MKKKHPPKLKDFVIFQVYFRLQKDQLKSILISFEVKGRTRKKLDKAEYMFFVTWGHEFKATQIPL